MCGAWCQYDPVCGVSLTWHVVHNVSDPVCDVSVTKCVVHGVSDPVCGAWSQSDSVFGAWCQSVVVEA